MSMLRRFEIRSVLRGGLALLVVVSADWARSQEPPKIYPKVLAYDVGHLMIWTYFLTGEKKYLDAIRPALKWYQEHRTDRGWAYYYNADGTPYVPKHWTLGTTFYGPEYGHFEDITYIEEAMAELDKGKPAPPTGALLPTPQVLADARAEAVKILSDPELIRWVTRDVQFAPNAQWVRYRPRYEPELYGVAAYGDIEKMIQYLLAVRIAADKVPPGVSVTGVPFPDGTFFNDLERRCWFATASGNRTRLGRSTNG